MALVYLTLLNGVPHAKNEYSAYDQDFTVTGLISTGTAVTLPASGTYNSAELEIYINNTRLDPISDYSYVGSVPRTQVQFTFDLNVPDIIRFRKDLV